MKAGFAYTGQWMMEEVFIDCLCSTVYPVSVFFIILSELEVNVKETNKVSKEDVFDSPVSTKYDSNSTKDNLDATSSAPPSEEKTDKKHGNNLNNTSEKDSDFEGKDDKEHERVDNVDVGSVSDADKLRDSSATETEDNAQDLTVATNQAELKSASNSEHPSPPADDYKVIRIVTNSFSSFSFCPLVCL